MNASAPDLFPPAGTILAGKYEVVRPLGKGGMGIVLEARHLKLGQNVALKLLLPSVRAVADVAARFEREGRAAARLTSPHVARILDVDALPDGTPFMVLELLRGRELGEELALRGPLPIREAVGYMLQACAGMAEAHRMGIVHRDLKPSNLFLCESDGVRTIKVLDFGISKLSDDIQASVTTTASAFGTPLYMSPEQVRSVKHVDARADIWSLGIVLYELLSGKTPFEAPSATAILAGIIADTPKPIQKLRSDVPSRLGDAVMRALQKMPDARYPEVMAFAEAIAPFGPTGNDPAQVAVSVELGARSLASGRYEASGVTGPGAPASRISRKGLLIGGAVALALGLPITVAYLVGRPPAAPSHRVALEAPGAASSPSAGAGADVSPTSTAMATAAAVSPVVSPEPTAEPATAPPAASPTWPLAPPRKKPPAAATTGVAPKATPPPSTDDPKYL